MTAIAVPAAPAVATAEPELDVLPFVRAEPAGGLNVLHLLVEGVHCGGCVRRIERALEQAGGPRGL